MRNLKDDPDGSRCVRAPTLRTAFSDLAVFEVHRTDWYDPCGDGLAPQLRKNRRRVEAWVLGGLRKLEVPGKMNMHAPPMCNGIRGTFMPYVEEERRTTTPFLE